ncbi:hypothetical protein [Dyella lutea]|uniref:Uncharacterized protein n=1 Tax=Dyella lutea TaxID=2950441 RepID=A0ABT1F8F4_9GAMM|nr:hypothetical protein [Dyella lutea]MCP1373660.1 hypothetical protein [Dyella lutea]
MAKEVDATMRPPVYAGTYAVRICRGDCPASTYRAATLVLFDRPLRDAQGRMHGKWLEQGNINGCLILDPVQGTPGGWVFYPGQATRRFIVWTVPDGHSIRFELDRTVDAGYQVELRHTPSGLAGTGMIWSASDPPGTPQRDEVRARRLGEADPARCPRLGDDSEAMKDVSWPRP